MDRSAIDAQRPGYSGNPQSPMPDKSHCGQITARCVISSKVIKPKCPREHDEQVPVLHKFAPSPDPHAGSTRWWGETWQLLLNCGDVRHVLQYKNFRPPDIPLGVMATLWARRLRIGERDPCRGTGLPAH
jgi:hypothetical protein